MAGMAATSASSNSRSVIYRFVLPETTARLAAASFSAATCSLCLRVCEWVRHHRRAGGSRTREPEPLCVSLTGTYSVSSVLYPSWQDFKSAKYCFRPRYWSRLRLCGVWPVERWVEGAFVGHPIFQPVRFLWNCRRRKDDNAPLRIPSVRPVYGSRKILS